MAEGAERTNRTVQDMMDLLKQYDTNHDGKLSPDELEAMKRDFKNKTGAYNIIKRRYLHGQDAAELSEHAINLLQDDLHTTDMALRYMAFTGAFARLVRYLAYTSDFGEAFRPVANPLVVRSAYGISWAYVVGDVWWEYSSMSQGKDIHGADLWAFTAKRAVFQSIASMLLPAVTIHTVVHETRKLVARYRWKSRWLPSLLGLSVVPFLPLYDEPVERIVDALFFRIYTPEHKGLGPSHH